MDTLDNGLLFLPQAPEIQLNLTDMVLDSLFQPTVPSD